MFYVKYTVYILSKVFLIFPIFYFRISEKNMRNFSLIFHKDWYYLKSCYNIEFINIKQNIFKTLIFNKNFFSNILFY